MMRAAAVRATTRDLLLILDGALGGPVAGVAPLDDGASVLLADPLVRSAGVMPQIASLLPSDERSRVVAVVVGTGPGSYSGIRSAAGAAASISIALGVPVAPLPSDRAIARAARSSVDLALGARELLRIDEGGARLLDRGAVELGEATSSRTLDEAAKSALVEPLLTALAEMGRVAVRTAAIIDPARTPIELRYLAHPRGTEGSGEGSR